MFVSLFFIFFMNLFYIMFILVFTFLYNKKYKKIIITIITINNFFYFGDDF